MDRRQFLKASAAVGLSSAFSGCQSQAQWERDAYRRPAISRVAILPARSYDFRLKEIILRGLRLFPLNIKGKNVVLKPNLVEFDPEGVINTNPKLIGAALDAFRSLGAREVVVAEGPGHRRDNEYLLTASGLYEILKEFKASYVDLNYDDLRPVRLKSSFTNLTQLYLPETLFKTDLLVSMPKLKTHHWAGVTLSLKNMFGVVPGSIYGWPKNVLHWAGIQGSILDINAALTVPQFAIVDGIVGMEGNGPLQGKSKHAGVIVLGNDFTAVDATGARLMKIEPRKIDYLDRAGNFLGNIAYDKIEQIGEPVETFEQDFRVIDSFQHVKSLIG